MARTSRSPVPIALLVAATYALANADLIEYTNGFNEDDEGSSNLIDDEFCPSTPPVRTYDLAAMGVPFVYNNISERTRHALGRSRLVHWA